MDTTTSVPLSVTQAATHARVSTKTIRRWLSSGRMQASRGPDGAWLVDPDELERAIATPGPSTDSPAVQRGRPMDMSIVQELIDRLERQAGELVTLRMERDQLASQLLALQAPAQPPKRRRWWPW